MKPEFEEASDDTPCGKVQEILALYFWAAGDRRRVGIAGLSGANNRIKADYDPETRAPDSGQPGERLLQKMLFLRVFGQIINGKCFSTHLTLVNNRIKRITSHR